MDFILLYWNLGKKQDELADMLRKEEDFLESKPILQERLEELGCSAGSSLVSSSILNL